MNILSETLPYTWGLTTIFFFIYWVNYRKQIQDWLQVMAALTVVFYLFYIVSMFIGSLDMTMAIFMVSLVIMTLEIIWGIMKFATLLFAKKKPSHKSLGEQGGEAAFYGCNILMLFWPLVFIGDILASI